MVLLALDPHPRMIFLAQCCTCTMLVFLILFWYSKEISNILDNWLTLFLPAVVTWHSYIGWFRPWPVGIGLKRMIFLAQCWTCTVLVFLISIHVWIYCKVPLRKGPKQSITRIIAKSKLLTYPPNLINFATKYAA